MTTSLEGCRLKIARAETHSRTLHDAIGKFLKGHPYGITLQFYADPDFKVPISEGVQGATTWGGLVYLGIHFEERRPAPVEWGILIGDLLHNLRSSLDHIAFALAGSKADDQTGFPIAVDKDWFDGRIPSMLDGVPTRAVTLIRSLQPYHRGQPAAFSHPLWMLHRLNNIDKHQTLHLAGLAMFDPGVDRVEVKNATREFIEVVASGPMEHGTLFIKTGFRLPATALPDDAEIETNLYLRSRDTIAFNQAGIFMGRPVLTTLDDLLVYVRDGIVPRFKRFFP